MKRSLLTILVVLFVSMICALGNGARLQADTGAIQELLPISESEGNGIHITQIVHATYNPNGPSSSNNCGPASLAMALRALGYFGYGNIARLNPEEQVDHARALMYNWYGDIYTITRQGIPYTQLNRDGDLSDVGTYGPGAIGSIGGSSFSVSGQSVLDKALDNGMPVVLFGYLTSNWHAQFSPQGHWGGTGGHYVAVTGKTYDGYYIVNDPLYQYGAEPMNYTQLTAFLGSGISGTAFFRKTPTPFAIKKTSDGKVNVFMRKRSDKKIYRTYQTTPNGGFTNWTAISTKQTGGNPVAIEQPNGRLLLFVRGTAGEVLMFQEDAYGNMSSYTDFGGETYYPLDAVKNQDGRVEFYARGVDHLLYKRYQTAANGSFSNWDTVSGGGSHRSGASAVLRTDGRIEIFSGYNYTAGASTPLAHTWQTTPNGGWLGYWTYSDLGGHIKGTPKAFVHGQGSGGGDGYIRAFVRSGTDNVLYYKSERENWLYWRTAGAATINAFGQPKTDMMTYLSGGTWYSDLMVFVRGLDNVTYWSRQEKRGSTYTWTNWSGNIEGIATSDPGAARFNNGRIFVTVRGIEGYMHYRVQGDDYGNWAAWANLGNQIVF